MRLEFNPRAICYNLYCDTHEEYDKIKQLMEKPITATVIKSIDNMIYADTDSVKAMKTKLNSIYGKAVMDMNKDYICVSVDKSPVVIFKDKIVAIEKRGEKASILCAHDVEFYTDNKYVDVVKMLV